MLQSDSLLVLRAITLLAGLAIVVPFAGFGGFWWPMPEHVQAQFGLPAGSWKPGVFLLLLLTWILNHWPSNGWSFVKRQSHFGPKVTVLGICFLGYLYGLLA